MPLTREQFVVAMEKYRCDGSWKKALIEDHAALLDERDAALAQRDRLRIAILRVIEATGIKRDNPTDDLSDELANIMQAFIIDKQNQFTEAQRVIEAMLESAYPHPIEHPTMTEAWDGARKWISQCRKAAV